MGRLASLSHHMHTVQSNGGRAAVTSGRTTIHLTFTQRTVPLSLLRGEGCCEVGLHGFLIWKVALVPNSVILQDAKKDGGGGII